MGGHQDGSSRRKVKQVLGSPANGKLNTTLLCDTATYIVYVNEASSIEVEITSGPQEVISVSGRYTDLQLTCGAHLGVSDFKKGMNESEKIQKRLDGGWSKNQFM